MARASWIDDDHTPQLNDHVAHLHVVVPVTPFTNVMKA